MADRAYASLRLLDRCRKLSDPITFITRLRLDAALYEPAPPRRTHQIGRPRIKGERLPNLSEVAEAPNTVWKPTTIANWYGSGERMVEVPPRRPFGTPRACLPCLCAGFWSVSRKESSNPKPFYVPTSMPIRRRSSRGL